MLNVIAGTSHNGVRFELEFKRGTVHIHYDEGAASKYPSSLVTSICLLNTEMFLGFLKTKRPDIVEKVVESLKTRLSELKMDDTPEGFDFTYDRVHLKDFPELEHMLKKVTMGYLDYSRYHEELHKQIASLPRRVIETPFLLVSYAYLESLAMSMTRQEVLVLFKDFIEFRTKALAAMLLPPTENLNVLYERHKAAGTMNIEASSALLDDGHLVGRVDRCMWKEILGAYDDQEFVGATICYFHSHEAEMANPNLVTTLTRTLVQGDAYCDFCWHDKRYDISLEHPPAETWDSL